MKIKRAGGIAAAIAVLGWTGIAQADHLCADQADRIEMKANMIGCANSDDYSTLTGTWDWDPIWQFKGGNDDGCKVHLGIASQLYVKHNKPQFGQGRSKTAYRDAKGAANALRDHKFENALLHLQNVVDTIESSARLNSDPDWGVFKGKTAAGWAKDIRTFAETIKLEIFDPDTGKGCSVK